jgi:light-regulated signal transduction histidine kinase (bacteriophytochrome)
MRKYLGLRFPATDIPVPARRLYLKNRTRIITNSSVDPSPIIARENGRRLDMTHSILRGVSKIHRQYQKNMGVVASMSIAIVNSMQELWGLVMVHNYSPRIPTIPERCFCQLIGKLLSLEIENIERRIEADKREKLDLIIHNLKEKLFVVAVSKKILPNISPVLDDICQLLQADGAMMKVGDEYIFRGQGSEKFLKELLVRMESLGTDLVYTKSIKNNLGLDDSTGIVCGAIFMSFRNDAKLILYRKAAIQVVHWGGKQTKNDKELTPRNSFEIWKEVHQDQCLSWNSLKQEMRAIHAAIEEYTTRCESERMRKWIEEEHAVQMELERKQKLLAKETEAKNAFVANTSHELR